MERGELKQARHVLEKAIGHNPDSAELHWHYLHVLLKLEAFRKGWEEYEWRRAYGVESREFPYVPWDGSCLKGKTVLVYAEQGIGDKVMFASCLPDVIAQAEKCIIGCNTRLAPVFSRSFPAATVHGCEKTDSTKWLTKQPTVDYQIAIGSLPRYFRSDIADYPISSEYLEVDPNQRALWQQRCSNLGDGLKIGISWFGGNDEKTRELRSVSLEHWEGIFKTQGVLFVSLQYGDCRKDIEKVEQDTSVVVHVMDEIDPLKELESYLGLISALYLVISIDNSTIHFAGSIGADVFAMLPLASDWRWFGSKPATPWYPAVKLFRQTTDGAWGDVLEKVENELEALVKKRT